MTDPADGSRDNPRVAVTAIVVGIGMLTAGDAIAKLVTESLTPFHYVLVRSLFAFIPVLIALQVSGTWRRLRTRRPWGQAGRGLAMALAYILYLQALQELPIADAVAIVFCAPFLVAVMARLLLGEEVPLVRWAAIGIGFVGTIVIVQPGTDAFRPASALEPCRGLRRGGHGRFSRADWDRPSRRR